jgi:3-oxoacyl-(acyl-carrier-protein) synthase
VILSEGAGAVLLGHDGSVEVERTNAGGYYCKRAQVEQALKAILSNLSESKIDIVIASANGTFIDKAECGAISQTTPGGFVYTAKAALGESVGAAGIWQTIVGAKALLEAELPPLLHLTATIPLRTSAARIDIASAQRAIVLSCGVNQQAAGLRLALP